MVWVELRSPAAPRRGAEGAEASRGGNGAKEQEGDILFGVPGFASGLERIRIGGDWGLRKLSP